MNCNNMYQKKKKREKIWLVSVKGLVGVVWHYYQLCSLFSNQF